LGPGCWDALHGLTPLSPLPPAQSLNRVESWGTLGDRSSWQTSGGMLFRDVWEQLIAWGLGDELDLGLHLRQGQQRRQQQAGAAGAARAAGAAAAGAAGDGARAEAGAAGGASGSARPGAWKRQRDELEAALASNGGWPEDAGQLGPGVPAGVAVVAAAAATTAEPPAAAVDAAAASSVPGVGSSPAVQQQQQQQQQEQEQQPEASSGSLQQGSAANGASGSGGLAEPSLQAANGSCSSGASTSARGEPQPVHVPVVSRSR
jgi:hypothetical protein